MVEHEKTNMTSDEDKEREQITITVDLDPAHQRMDVALRESGVDVEQAVAQKVTPQVEQALYQILQGVKYEQ